MRSLGATVLAIAGAALLSGHTSSQQRDAPATPASFTLSAEYIVPRPTVTPSIRFGGISGLAPLGDGHEMLAVSDDRENSRVYRLRISHEGARLRVEAVGVIALERGGGAPAKLDPEGIALTTDGHILISSEGIGNVEPRLPPAIVEYSSDGRFVRQLEVRPRFAPNERGPLTTGVLDNAGFEALSMSPDGRLFTAVEVPLVQDADAGAFGPHSRTRVLEYVAAGGTFRPAREFAYDVSPMAFPPFVPRLAVNGIVELIALGGDDLLALERGYTESIDKSQFVNKIRIFRISLAGATDISAVESLRTAAGVNPVKKTLLGDFDELTGLSPALARLDNFEGMAWGPAAADRQRPLVVVSDDNFAQRQVTAFLELTAGPPKTGARRAFH